MAFKIIGEAPDREGFTVDVEEENIFISQCSGCPGDDCDGEDSDLVKLHYSDAGTLIDLLVVAVEQVASARQAKMAKEANEEMAKAYNEEMARNAEKLHEGIGPHNPDGSCCEELPPTDVDVDACNDPDCCLRPKRGGTS